MLKRKTISFVIFLFCLSSVSTHLFAQEPCASAPKLLDVSDFCSASKAYSNATSIPSTFNAAVCWENPLATQDIWIKFTAIGTDLQVIALSGGANGTIKNANLALMTGCTIASQLECSKATNDTTRLYKGGLTPGVDYYIRIASSTADAGTFKLCIDNYNPPLNPQADCDAAVKLCDKSPLHVAGLSGIGNIPDETIAEDNCFGTQGEHNNAWYYWVCETAGTLTFELTPNDGVSDIDFVLYSINTGSNICSGRKTERCGATNCLNPGGGTGLNLTDTDISEQMGCDLTLPASDRNGYVKYLNMIAGKTYALLIDNVKTNTGFTLEFGGTGTFRGPSAKITADLVSICEGQTILYTSNSANHTSLEWNFTSGSGTPDNQTGKGPYTIAYNSPGKFVAILKAKTAECSATDYLNIVVNPMPTVTLSSKEICAGDSTKLNAIASLKGGTYSWSSGVLGDSSLVVKPLKDTTYLITYTKAGCSASAMGNVTVIKLPVVTVNSETICKGSSVTLTASIKETTGMYVYQWSTGATTQSIVVSPLVKTSYTVTVRSIQGCVGEGVGVVTIASNLSVDAGKDTTICLGDTVHFHVTPNGTGYTYKWVASNGVISDSLVYDPKLSPLVTTTYFVELTNYKGCTGWDTVTVFINPAITAAIIPTNTSCKGLCDGELVVSAEGGTPPYTYNWTHGATTAVCKQLCSGTYTVAVTDKNGCHSSKDTLIAEPPSLDLQIVSSNSSCNKPSGSATVIVSGGTIGAGYTYLWNDTDMQTTATATNLLNKQYCVTVTDGNGCKATACLVVLSNNGPKASLSSVIATSCYGNCNGSATITAVGGAAPYSYSWNTLPIQLSPVATGLCAGEYVATVSDNSGCTDTVHVKIIQPLFVTIDLIAPITSCVGNAVTIKAIARGGDGKYKYNWQPELLDTTSTVIVSPLVTTVYHIVVKDGKGCASSQISVTVNVNNPIKVVASSGFTICQKDSVKISATASGGIGSYSYTWFPGAIKGDKMTVAPMITTTYTISVKDSCSSIAGIDSVTVNVSAPPQIDFKADIVKGCSPLQVEFTDLTGGSGDPIKNWNWSFGDGSSSDVRHPSHVFVKDKSNTDGFTITLSVTSLLGCKATLKNPKMIQLYPKPVASFETSKSLSMLEPTVHFTNSSQGAKTYVWDFGDSFATAKDNKSNFFDPDHIYSDAGEYCVRLIAKNEGGCLDSLTKCITIEPEFVLFIPTAFTPNGDGDNDEFVAKGEYISEFEIRIYNRWGVLFYNSNDISEGWNGRMKNNGGEINQDIYVYQIDIKDVKLRKHRFIGRIALIKGE